MIVVSHSSANGYATATAQYLNALRRAGVQYTYVETSGRPPNFAGMGNLLGAPGERLKTTVVHAAPGLALDMVRDMRVPMESGSKSLGLFSVWETVSLPKWLASQLFATFDYFITATEFNAQALRKAGVDPDRVHVVPHTFEYPAEVESLDRAEARRVLALPPDVPILLYTGSWNPRKNPEALVEMFSRAMGSGAFPSETLLVLKITGSDTLREYVWSRFPELESNIWVITEQLDWQRIQALHSAANVYVSAHRGEGWGYGMHLSQIARVPFVATGFSGPAEFATPHDRLVPYRLVDCPRQSIYPHFTFPPEENAAQWAEPSLKEMVSLVGEVLTQSEPHPGPHLNLSVDSVGSSYARVVRRYASP